MAHSSFSLAGLYVTMSVGKYSDFPGMAKHVWNEQRRIVCKELNSWKYGFKCIKLNAYDRYKVEYITLNSLNGIYMNA
jgi:hypothetical protein